MLTKVPDVTENLADQIARIVRSIRQLDLKKAPSVSRDARLGAHAAAAQHRARSTSQTAKETLHILLKYQTDIAKAAKELTRRRVVDRSRSPTCTAGSPGPNRLLMLDLLNGFVVELRNAGLPGQPHREPRRDGGGAAHPDRGPRGVQVRARRHAGQEQRPLARVRDRVRGVLRAARPRVQARRRRRDRPRRAVARDAGAAAPGRGQGRRRAGRWTRSRPKRSPRC